MILKTILSESSPFSGAWLLQVGDEGAEQLASALEGWHPGPSLADVGRVNIYSGFAGQKLHTLDLGVGLGVSSCP